MDEKDLIINKKEEEKIKQLRLKQKKDLVEKKTFSDVLKIFSPGTAIRTALDDILHAGMGALIVLEKEGISNIIDGGFRINCKFSPQRLVELAKMDGAIVLSNDLKKILYSNVFLNPNTKISTKETGTRHKAAERTAKQYGAIVIAVSERRRKTSLYFGEENYCLEETSEILRRAAETLQILEKQKENFDEMLSHLNVLEITNLVSMEDVCKVLQTSEIIRRISESVKRYLIELGKEGIIVSMRLKELVKNVQKERIEIISDYFSSGKTKKEEILSGINLDFLLETQNILRILFSEIHDKPISSGGFRILEKTNLLKKEIKLLVDTFETLDRVFDSDRNSLLDLFKNENLVDSILEELKKLKEKILMSKRIY